MSARFDKTSGNENLPELIGKRAGARCARCAREDESVWIVARWQRCQVIAERLHERQHDSSPGLAGRECNLASLEIDGAPCEFCQVTEPLSEIQAEKHKTAPFSIVTARFQNALDFRERECAPRGFVARFEKLHAQRRIAREQLLPGSFAETYPQNFQGQISGRACAFFRLAITKPRDVVRLQRGKIAIGFRSEKFDEPFDDALVTVVRGSFRFNRLRLKPRFAPRFDRMTFQRFDVGHRENVGDTARDHFAGSVHAQLSVARLQRGLVPRATDFERLLFVASFRRSKDALAGVSFGVEDRECAEPKRSARLFVNAWHGA